MNGANVYQRTEVDTTTQSLALLLPILPASVVVVGIAGHGRVGEILLYAFVAIAVGLGLWTLSRMTVRVDSAGVRWFLGFGWPQRSIDFAKIVSVRVVEDVHKRSMLPFRDPELGLVWMASGSDGVRVECSDGTIVSLGSTDAAELRAAVDAGRANLRS